MKVTVTGSNGANGLAGTTPGGIGGAGSVGGRAFAYNPGGASVESAYAYGGKGGNGGAGAAGAGSGGDYTSPGGAGGNGGAGGRANAETYNYVSAAGGTQAYGKSVGGEGGLGGAGDAGAPNGAYGTGGAGGAALALTSDRNAAGSAQAESIATGGLGGYPIGGFVASGNGGGAYGQAFAASSFVGAGASATVIATGGAGGHGESGGPSEFALGGDGASVTLDDAVGGYTNGGALTLTQKALGGQGGGDQGGASGSGGAAYSRLALDDTTSPTASAKITANVIAYGGSASPISYGAPGGGAVAYNQVRSSGQVYTNTVAAAGLGDDSTGTPATATGEAYGGALAKSTVTAFGGFGGNQAENDLGPGAGGAANATSLASAVSAYATSTATGAKGGGQGSDGGDAQSTATALGGVSGIGKADSTANGGAGGPGLFQTGLGGAGGAANATASAKGKTAYATATAVGGEGGGAYIDTYSGVGAVGGAATGSAVARGYGGTAKAALYLTGGAGGIGYVTGGAGGSATAYNDVGGFASNGGTLYLTQDVTGGYGAGKSQLDFNDLTARYQSAVQAQVKATGGDGFFGEGLGGAGKAVLTVYGGEVAAKAIAVGGDSGTAGDASAKTKVSGTSGYFSAYAATTTAFYELDQVVGYVSAKAVGNVGGLTTAKTKVAIGGAGQPFVAQGSAVAFQTGSPTAAIVQGVLSDNADIAAAFGPSATVFSIDEMGGAYAVGGSGSETTTETLNLGVDLRALASPQDLVVGFYDPTTVGSGFQSLTFTLTGNGQTLVSKTFTTLAAADKFFTDHSKDLGSLASGPLSGDTLDLVATLSLTTDATGSGFYFQMITGDPPGHATSAAFGQRFAQTMAGLGAPAAPTHPNPSARAPETLALVVGRAWR